MQYKIGNLYTKFTPNQVIFATCNNVINSRGLVMGGGNALAMAKAIPEAPALLGNRINEILRKTNGKFYGIAIAQHNDYHIGAFQSKYHYADPSTLELIRSSLLILDNVASHNPSYEYHIPMPGIGLGGIPFNDVKNLIDSMELSENIYVWTYGK